MHSKFSIHLISQKGVQTLLYCLLFSFKIWAEGNYTVEVLRSPDPAKRIPGLIIAQKQLGVGITGQTKRYYADLTVEFEAKGRNLIADEPIVSGSPTSIGRPKITYRVSLTKKLVPVYFIANGMGDSSEHEQIILSFKDWDRAFPELSKLNYEERKNIELAKYKSRKSKRELTAASNTQLEADPKRSKIDLGIHVGLNPSTTSVTGSGLEYGTRTGLVAGVETDLRVNYYLSLELGLLYSQKGASVNFASGSTSSTFKYQWNYLELPLLVKANFSTGNFSPFAVAGPYGALLLSAHTNTTASDGTSSETNSDTKGQMKKFDYGIYAGLGADFKLNNRFSLTSQTRFGLGLANVTTVGEMTRIRNVEILIGLKLAIK